MTLRAWISWLVVLAAFGIACDDDVEPSDDTDEDGGSQNTDEDNPVTLRDGGRDPGVIVLTCEGVDDGTSCGSMGGLICLDDECVTSVCGDSFADPRADEDCDDGNDLAGDGCEPDCSFTCSEVDECSDGNACNGNEVCDTAEHVCVAGTTATDETPCTSTAVAEGECRSGTCVPKGCGDESVEGLEECDDGNQDSGDGCEPTCTFTCEEDVDCNDNNVCNGEESCDPSMHTCAAGTLLECGAQNECSLGACDAITGCQTELVDADGDRYPPDTLSCGTDCDDTRADVNPGQAELCDDIDQDCDGEAQPEQAPMWYVDCDADGYAELGADKRRQCEEPKPASCGGRWTTREPSMNQDPPTVDCFDQDPQVRPDQNAWFAKVSDYGFDFNCSGAEELLYAKGKISATASCFSSERGECVGGTGWVDAGPPACGKRADFTECQGGAVEAAAFGGGIIPIEPCGIRICECYRVTVERTQECHRFRARKWPDSYREFRAFRRCRMGPEKGIVRRSFGAARRGR